MLHDLFYTAFKDVRRRNIANAILVKHCEDILAKYPDPPDTCDNMTKRMILDTKTVLPIMKSLVGIRFVGSLLE